MKGLKYYNVFALFKVAILVIYPKDFIYFLIFKLLIYCNFYFL